MDSIIMLKLGFHVYNSSPLSFFSPIPAVFVCACISILCDLFESLVMLIIACLEKMFLMHKIKYLKYKVTDYIEDAYRGYTKVTNYMH